MSRVYIASKLKDNAIKLHMLKNVLMFLFSWKGTSMSWLVKILLWLINLRSPLVCSIFVVLVEGPIHKFQYPRYGNFLY